MPKIKVNSLPDLSQFIIDLINKNPTMTKADIRIALKKEVSKSDKIFNIKMAKDSPVTEAEFINNHTDLSKVSAKQLAKVTKAIETEIPNLIEKLRKKGASEKEIHSAIKTRFNLKDNHVRTISNTTNIAISRKINFDLSERIGVNKFKYSGAVAGVRRFCALHLNAVYTLEQIKKMNNGQGLPVRYYLGGWNCRHDWEPVHDFDENDFRELNSEDFDEHKQETTEYFAEITENQNQALIKYIGTGYKFTNLILISNPRDNSKKTFQRLKSIEEPASIRRQYAQTIKEIEELPKNRFKENVILWRGESVDKENESRQLKAVKNGKLKYYVTDAFFSTTKNEHAAEFFLGYKGDIKTTWKIYVRKNTEYVPGSSFELEVIFMPGTVLRIIKVNKINQMTHLIEAEIFG